MNDQEYSYIKDRILKLTNLDLDGYKSHQMRRRLDGFVAKSASSNVIAYCRMLEGDPKKVRELMDFLAINVSEFFRDWSQFQYLKSVVLPELLQRSPKLNIWSAACSCGQEPYSMAMILEDLGRLNHHRILATDIDESALEQAIRGGPYPPSEVRNVDKRFLTRFFRQTDAGYWVTDEIKKKVEFRRHNLLVDYCERGFDLIVCRNAIIYFSDGVRDNLYKRFHGALKVDGVLFTGGSEVILRPTDLNFRVLHSSFYRRLPVNAGAALPLKI